MTKHSMNEVPPNTEVNYSYPKDALTINLYDTNIVTFSYDQEEQCARLRLNVGEWDTPTTRNRINWVLSHLLLGRMVRKSYTNYFYCEDGKVYGMYRTSTAVSLKWLGYNDFERKIRTFVERIGVQLGGAE